jgi:hypothetical protein
MLAARVEPKNGPQENKKTGNFKPLVLGQFQTGVDRGLGHEPKLDDEAPEKSSSSASPRFSRQGRSSLSL